MIVACVTTELTAEQRARLGTNFPQAQAERLGVGEHYVVLGLQYETRSIIWGTGAWVQLPVQRDVVFAPLYLFDVIDGRPSRHWEVRLWEDGSLTLWPPAFYREYFHDDLRAGAASAVAELEHTRALLEREEQHERPQPAPPGGP